MNNTFDLPEEPYVLQQYDVTFSKEGQPDCRTFTWGQDRDAAIENVRQLVSKTNAWDGWTFRVADEPNPIP